MAIRDAAALGGTVLQLVDTIQRFGNNYYKASAAWDDFPRQVRLLPAKHDSFKTSLDRYGLLENLNPHILAVLEDAEKYMLEEIRTLQGSRARDEAGRQSTGRVEKVLDVVFVERAGRAIQRAIKAYEDAEGLVRADQEGHEQMRKAMKTRPIPLCLPQHSRDHYVPLECEYKIYSSLKESGPSCPTVVLLYGGSGKGKSTVARQISSTFQDDRSIFTQVVMLECGMKVDIQAKTMELLQRLGWDDSSEMSEERLGQGFNVITHGRLQNQLRLLVQRQNLLIVLDDLWERDLLQSLLNLSGSDVKYLVTSQREDVCTGSTCSPNHLQRFQIDDLQRHQSRRMLAIHVGYRDERIPDHLQDVADEIIDQAGGIPLVIGSIGAQIRKAGEDADLEVWQCASKSLIPCLNEQPLMQCIDG